VTGVNHTSYIGFKGTEDLGGGLKATWQVESEIGKTQDSTHADPVFANRNTYVGLAGGFGEVRIGRHDTPYKIATGGLDPFGDSLGDYNAIIGSYTNGAGKFDARAAGTVAYISPNFNGLTAAVAYISVQNAEATGADNQDAWSLAAMYDNGPLFASVAYEAYNGNLGSLSGATNKSIDAWKVGLGYKFGDTKVGVVFENIEIDVAASAKSRDAWHLSVAHTMGPMVLKAAYGQANESDANADDDATMWTLGVDYNMSKRTALYAVYTTLDNGTGGQYGIGDGGKLYATDAGKDVDGFSVGIKHTF
jgi:predicted porin